MKNQQRPARRSARKDTSETEFVIDSRSAIAEFKRHRPDAIIEDGDDTARVKLLPKDFDLFMAGAAARATDVVLALDHITDARNLGAVVRSAAFFGIKEIIVPQDRQALFSQGAVSTSMGGFALTDLVVVVNLSRALTDLKDAGYWIVGADMQGEPLDGVAGKYEKMVVVLGAEDKGLSHNIKSKCDLFTSISGAATAVESLNVAVAAGILMHALRR
ncbi:MAG: RNA methyltransferase [Planctomycetota bacterium]|nr:RNA methyltransferase [Planctomycetota bacterium]